MKSLLKANLHRLFKEKVFWIGLILLAVFSFGTTALMKGVSVIITNMEDSSMSSVYSSMFSGKMMFLSSFSMTNNMGLVIVILLCIYMMKDFSQGIIRNKIMIGYSRFKICTSMLLVLCIFGLILYLLNATFSLWLGSIFLGYDGFFEPKEILNNLKILCLAGLIFLGLVSYLHFICTITRSIGLAITFSVGTILVLTALSQIYLLDPNSTILHTICDFNPMYQLTLIQSDGLQNQDILFILIESCILFGGFYFLTYAFFKKAELK